jgi:hypothetical protein
VLKVNAARIGEGAFSMRRGSSELANDLRYIDRRLGGRDAWAVATITRRRAPEAVQSRAFHFRHPTLLATGTNEQFRR